MTKREFLKLMGMGGLGVIAAPGVWATTAAGSRAPVAPKLVYDGRYANAADYAIRLREHGIQGVDTQGDLVGLWYRDADAFRLRPGQALLGYTAWSDYQVLRILLNDARRGRGLHPARPSNPGRLALLQPHSKRDWPAQLAACSPSMPDREKRVHLVTWSLSGA